jgi:PAS domain S-box-containing protein
VRRGPGENWVSGAHAPFYNVGMAELPSSEFASAMAEHRARRRALARAAGASDELLRIEDEADAAVDGTIRRILATQEALLRDASERLHLAVEASDLGIWDYDPGTHERRWSARCKQIFGFPADDAIVTQEAFLAALHPDDRPRWYAAAAEAINPDGEGRYRIEYRVIRVCDGQERWIAATGRTIFEGRRPVRMLGTLADVTAQKRAEEERELFLAMLGHDLRNPLAAIAVGAKMLSNGADPHVLRMSGLIARSAARMKGMIDDLLDLARARAGRFRIERRPVELGALCREVVAELGLGHPDRTITVAAEDGVTGAWDKDRIEQVIQNLVSNALTHGRLDTPVDVRTGLDGSSAFLDVSNQGVPIPAGERDHLFDPFHRGAAGEGLGLGLYIAKHIVAAHGGSLSVTSNEQATRFRVTLPR